MALTSAFFLDLAERTAATAAAAGAAYAVQELADLPAWWAPIAVTGLTVGKGWLASFLGRKGTPSLLPAGADPASRE